MPSLNGRANYKEYLTYNEFKYHCIEQDNLVQLSLSNMIEISQIFCDSAV
jgi:hypothetical protein